MPFMVNMAADFHTATRRSMPAGFNASVATAGDTKIIENCSPFRWLSAKIVFIFSLALACIAIFALGIANYFGDHISRGGHSASTSPLEIVIANAVLKVPANMVRFSSQRKNGTQSRLELYMHWPTLSGYSDDLKNNFSDAGQQPNLIFASLEPRSMSLDMSGRMKPIYSKFFEGPPLPAMAGLLRQPLSAEGGFIDEDIFYQFDSPYPFAVRCVRETSKVATPYCLRDIHLRGNLMLTYRFHIRHLHHWIAIESAMREKISAMILNN